MGQPLSALQKQALEKYQDAVGDSYFEEPPTVEEVNENHHGDGLLTFVINEVGDAQDDAADARRMLIRAAQQLLYVAEKLR